MRLGHRLPCLQWYQLQGSYLYRDWLKGVQILLRRRGRANRLSQPHTSLLANLCISVFRVTFQRKKNQHTGWSLVMWLLSKNSIYILGHFSKFLIGLSYSTICLDTVTKYRAIWLQWHFIPLSTGCHSKRVFFHPHSLSCFHIFNFNHFFTFLSILPVLQQTYDKTVVFLNQECGIEDLAT